MEEQRKLIEQSINENKYYMSEKENHDVGYTAAEQDFIDKHLSRVAKEFREFFCSRLCPDNKNCGWEKVFKKKILQ
jgi:hypothetical protein